MAWNPTVPFSPSSCKATTMPPSIVTEWVGQPLQFTWMELCSMCFCIYPPLFGFTFVIFTCVASRSSSPPVLYCCINMSKCIYWFYLGCFLAWVFVNSASMNMHIMPFVGILCFSVGYKPRSEIAGMCVFSCNRSCRAVFQSGWFNLLAWEFHLLYTRREFFKMR